MISNSLFSEAKISNLVVTNKSVIDIECHQSLESALDLMHSKNIASLPVYGTPGHFLSSGNPQLAVHLGKQYIGNLCSCGHFI